MNIIRFVLALLVIQFSSCSSQPITIPPKLFSVDPISGKTSEVALAGIFVEDLMAELKVKKVDTSRWGDISKNFDQLKVGMPQKDVEKLIGPRGNFPKDKNIWQYCPNEFNGGTEGSDWNLVIHMKNKKVFGFQLLRYAYGPPPG